MRTCSKRWTLQGMQLSPTPSLGGLPTHCERRFWISMENMWDQAPDMRPNALQVLPRICTVAHSVLGWKFFEWIDKQNLGSRSPSTYNWHSCLSAAVLPRHTTRTPLPEVVTVSNGHLHNRYMDLTNHSCESSLSILCCVIQLLSSLYNRTDGPQLVYILYHSWHARSHHYLGGPWPIAVKNLRE